MTDLGFNLQWLTEAIAVYGSILMNLIFIFAAGMLLAHFKNAFSFMFFFGLMLTSICSIAIRLIIQWRLFDSAEKMQHQIQLLSVVSSIAFFVQVIGFLLLVFYLIERKKANAL